MPKKNKTSPAISANPVEAGPSTPLSPGAPKAQPRKRAEVAHKAAARKSAGKKAGAVTKSSQKRAAKKSAAPAPSDAEIATRAYFIAERRHQNGIEGDSAHDWLEARRQLIEEAAPAGSKARHL